MRVGTCRAAQEITQEAENGGRRLKAAMLTLTYREQGAWNPRHVSETLDHIRKYLGRRGEVLRGVWVAELTQRGRVHYHLLLWLPRGTTLPKPDKQGWWRHGSTRIEWARSGVGYMVKYASKGDSVERFPRGLRLHGRCGLELLQRRRVAWHCLPRYVREHFTECGAWVVRAYGGGWVDRGTGEWLEAWHPPPPLEGGSEARSAVPSEFAAIAEPRAVP